MIFSGNFTPKIALIVFVISTFYTSFVLSINCDLEPKNNDGRLRKRLFCNYDKSVHPSKFGLPVNVNLKMVLKGFSFSDHNQVLEVSSWLSMTWTDDNLKWSPSEFNNIDEIVESSDSIWQPDLQLFNSDIASVQEEQCKVSNCMIKSTGIVSCIPPCIHTARCSADFSAWPFDTQNCSLHVGTWLNPADEVSFRLTRTVIPETNLESQDRLWKMIKVVCIADPGSNATRKYYPSVNFNFLLERNSAQEATMFLIPGLIMASINLISLWLAPETSQRLMLLAFNIMSHFLFMQQLSWYVPMNGEVCPTIVSCFRDSLLMSGFLLINTIIVRGLSTCGFDVPSWVGSTTNYMGSNRFGQLFLSKNYLIDKEPLNAEQFEETTDAEIPEAQTIPKVIIKPPTNTWTLFAKCVDRLLFIIVFGVYISMYFLLVPTGYKYNQPRGELEVISTIEY